MAKKLTAYFKLLRVNEWYGKVALITAVALSFGHQRYPFLLILAIYAINILNNAFAFGINDIEDAEDDAKDPKKVNRNPISAGLIDKKESYIVVSIAALLCLGIASIFNTTTVIFCFLTLLVGFLYSYKPIRLKSMPILDVVSHGFFLGSAQFVVPALALGIELSPLFLFTAAMMYANSIFGDVYNEIRDYEVDRKTNIRNTASFVDLRKYENYVHLLHILALILVLIASLANLKIGLRTPVVIAVAATLIFGSLMPKNIKKRVLSSPIYSESLMTLASLVFLYLSFN